jgi:hypothetical protein
VICEADPEYAAVLAQSRLTSTKTLAVIPGRVENASHDVQLRIGE